MTRMEIARWYARGLWLGLRVMFGEDIDEWEIKVHAYRAERPDRYPNG